MLRRLALAALSLAFVSPALAGPASEAVRFFYEPVKWEADPQYRDRFTDPVRRLFEQNDRTPEGEMGCIDYGPGIDAQDYDDATIAKTLKLTEQVDGANATVTAMFTLFPDHPGEARREMRWLLVKEGGDWKIADIESVTNGWKLSELACIQDE